MALPKYVASKRQRDPFARAMSDAYQQFMERHAEFEKSDVVDLARSILQDVDYEILVERALDHAWTAEDSRHREIANSAQLDMFDDAAFQGTIPAAGGETKRVVLDDARVLSDMVHWVQVGQANVNNVVGQQNRRIELLVNLQSYVTSPATQVHEARLAWQADHPRHAPTPAPTP